MKKLLKSAELSKQYTNHCIRATAVNVLDQNNFEARYIMRVSGHKSEASIRSYSRRLSEEKQRDISNSLSHYCGFSSSKATSDIRSVPDSESEAAARVPRLVTESSSSCIEISSQEYQPALDTVLYTSSPLPCSSLPGSPVLKSYSQKNTTKNETVSFQPGAFKNCNGTTNFNYK